MWDPVREKSNMLSRLGDFWYSVLAEEDVPLAHKLAHLPFQCRVIRQADAITNMLIDGGQFHDNFLLIKFTDKDVIWFGKKDAIQKQHLTGQAGEVSGNSRLLDLTIPDHTLIQSDNGENLAIPWHAIAFALPGEDIRFSEGMYLKFGLAIDPNLRVTSIRTDEGKMLYEYQDFVSEYGRLYFYRNPISLFPRMEFLAHSYDYRRRNIYCYPLGVDVYGPVDRIIYYARISQSPRSLYRAAAQAAGIPVVKEDCRVIATSPLGDGLSYYTSDGRRYDADFPHTHLKRGTELKEGEVIAGKELYNLVLPQDPIPGSITYINLDFALPVKGLRAPNKVITAKSGSNLRPAFEGETEALNKYYAWLSPYSGNSAYSSIPASINGITLVRDYLCARRVIIACVNVYQMPRDMYLRLVAFLRRELPLGSVLCTAPLYIPIDETADIEKPQTPPPLYPPVDQSIGNPQNRKEANIFWWQWGPDLIPYGTLKRIKVLCSRTIPSGAYTGSFYLGVWQVTTTPGGNHFQRIATSREARKLGAGQTLEFTFRDTPLRGRALRLAPLAKATDVWWPTVAYQEKALKLGMAVDTPEETGTMAYSWNCTEELWRVIGEISYETGKLISEPTVAEEELVNWFLQFDFKSDSGPVGRVDLSHLFDISDPALRSKMQGYIDWGDGTLTEITPDMPTDAWKHSYTGSGPYHLGIKGHVGVKPEAAMEDTGLGPYLRGVEIRDKSPLVDWEELRETPDIFHGLSFRNCPKFGGFTGENIYGQLDNEERRGIKNLEFGELFKGCKSLPGVPTGIFDFPALDRLDATSMFEGCTSLSKVPKDLFPYPPSETLITERMFAGCTGLRGEVPQFLTQETAPSELWDATEMFEGDTGLSGVVPDFFIVPPGGVTVFTEMFRGCTGLSGLKEPDYEYYTDTDRKTWVDGMFYGCSGLNSEIPDMWNHFLDPDTEHKDCFKTDWNSTNWEEVPMDWGGEEQLQYAVRFYMTTTARNQKVDISAWFYGIELEHQGRVKWGDHTPVINFSSYSPLETLQHVYSTPGEYRLEVTHTASQDYIRMNGLLTTDLSDSVASIRSFLTSVDMKETVRVKYIGDGIFDSCTKLKRVVWSKLFLRTYAWEGPEVFLNALRLHFADSSKEADLKAWFSNTKGRIKWGEYGDVVSFSTGANKELRHTYRHKEKGYWIEMEPDKTGVLRMDGLLSESASENPNSLSLLSTKFRGIDVKGDVKLQYIGDGIFFMTSVLSYVNWKKLFRPDYADFPTEEMFENALVVKFSLDEDKVIDLKGWLSKSRVVRRVKWGDHSEIVESTKGATDSITHTYKTSHDVTIEIAPKEGSDKIELTGYRHSFYVTKFFKHQLLSVSVRGHLHINYYLPGIFYFASNLKKVEWEKLFCPDFTEAGDGSVIVPNAIRFLFVLPLRDNSIDISAWFAEGSGGKVRWVYDWDKINYQDFSPDITALSRTLTSMEKPSGGTWVEVAPSEPDGELEIHGLLNTKYTESALFIQSHLKAVDVRGRVKLKGLGLETFFRCTRLEWVNWKKLFRPDYANSVSEEMFKNMLRLHVMTIEEKVDLSNWFAGEGRGKLKWGDHGEVFAFDASPKEEFTHTYATSGEYVVDISPMNGEPLTMQVLEQPSLIQDGVRKVDVVGDPIKLALRGSKTFLGGAFLNLTRLKEVCWEGLMVNETTPTEEPWNIRFRFEGISSVTLSAWFSEVDRKTLLCVQSEEGCMVKVFSTEVTLHGLIGQDAAAKEIREHLTSVEIRDGVKVKFDGKGIFDGCTKLRQVTWEGLFRPDFFWDGEVEETFDHALRLHFFTPSTRLNLSFWLISGGSGKIKWGDHSKILEYTGQETEISHEYEQAGEHIVEIAPTDGPLQLRGLLHPHSGNSIEDVQKGLRKIEVIGEELEVTGNATYPDAFYMFNGCTDLARVDWEKLKVVENGEREGRKAGILLHFCQGKEIDLSAWFEEGKVQVEWPIGGTKNSLTYTVPDEEDVWVHVSGEEIRMKGLLDPEADEISVQNIREHLTEVFFLGDTTKVKFTGDGVFDGCRNLHRIEWKKIFNPEYAYSPEIEVRNYLLLSVISQFLDLSPWLAQTGAGRIDWGDGSRYTAFTAESNVDVFRHIYRERDEYKIRIIFLSTPTLRGLISSVYSESLREGLIGMEIVGRVELSYTGVGIFDGCRKLKRVPWDKIFNKE